MIRITGDIHGEYARFSPANMEGENEWTEHDYLIVCGDFGMIFYDSDEEKRVLDELEKKPYTVCFVDGNHENFNALYSYPEQSWMGGRVHRIRKNVLHLMRGHVFNIDGKRFFTMGGAYSVDSYLRTEGKSVWKQELPSDAEYKQAIAVLKEVGFEVDYILTHTAPREVIRKMGKYPHKRDYELTGFLEWVMHETKFKKWFFGHWHTDEEVYDRFRALYYDVVEIG